VQSLPTQLLIAVFSITLYLYSQYPFYYLGLIITKKVFKLGNEHEVNFLKVDSIIWNIEEQQYK